MMNMLATECSRPMATKAEIGNQMATILPGRSLAIEAIHTAMHTSQLHRMPRTSAVLKGRLVLATAAPTEAPPPTSVPPAATRAARASEPTKLPVYETLHDLISLWAAGPVRTKAEESCRGPGWD
jgi:hypothetical protein